MVNVLLKMSVVLILYRLKPLKMSESAYIDYVLIGIILCIL